MPRRITRASLQKISARSLSLVEEPQSGNSTTTLAKKSSKVKKNVKFLDSSIEETIKNCSIISDEGIDMSFSPHLKIPSAITRPQHKLKQHWSWWYSARKRNLSWSQNQLHVSSMATVEEFWHCYNQVKLASKLPCGHTYAVFKQGTMPDWEDAANVEGGRWMLSFEKNERSSRLDERWMEALLMTLGDHLSQIITGVQVCVRGKQDRVEVWVGDISNMREVAGVGRRIKQQLGLGLAKMEFSIHTEEKEGFKGPCLTI